MAKPVVDGLEREVGERAQVLRLSVTDRVGEELAIRYGVRGIPTLVLLDGAGRVMLTQAGIPNREEVVATVVGLLKK